MPKKIIKSSLVKSSQRQILNSNVDQQKIVALTRMKIKEALSKKENELENQNEIIKAEETPLLLPKNAEPSFSENQNRIQSLENVIAATAVSSQNQNANINVSPYVLNTNQAHNNYSLADNYGMPSVEKIPALGNNDQRNKDRIPFSHDIEIKEIQQSYQQRINKKPW